MTEPREPSVRSIEKSAFGTGGPAPAVSVIIPTFQRRDLVRRAVTSVLGQTFRDFELIVVDNGSTDGTAEALATFGDRLRYVLHPERGVARARNAGLRLAGAPVIAFLDSDNRWLPDHLATLTALLARHPEAVLASTCPGFRVAGRQSPEDAQLADPWSAPLTIHAGYISCVAVRREAILAVGGFDESFLVGEDTDLFLRLAARDPFCLLRRRTIVKTHTPGSLWERGCRSGAYLDAEERIMRDVLAELGRRGACADRAAARDVRGWLHFLSALCAIREGDDDAARRSLAAACALYPELGRKPFLIATRLGRIGESGPDDRLGYVEKALSLWPQTRSDTALYLRLYAAALALSAGRLRHAGKLLLGCVRPVAPGFLLRNLPALVTDVWTRLARSVKGNGGIRGKDRTGNGSSRRDDAKEAEATAGETGASRTSRGP